MKERTKEKPIVYKVHVEHQRVSIEAIPSNSSEYAIGLEHATQRLREAIEIERELAASSTFSLETRYFTVLDTAKEFAEMVIHEIEERLNDDYTAVENFKG